jgi:hypothetical protein
MQLSRLCWVALAAMICAGAGPQEKVQLNTITKVEVRGNSVEIIGDRKPNFTTFSMADPPRLVVDFSEAIFGGVPDELRGNGDLVAGIKTASYGSDASAIARVVIGFSRNVDTDIAIGAGNKLVIKALGEGSPAVAEASLARESPKVSPAKKPDVAVAAVVPSTVPNTESSPAVVPGTKSKPAQAAPEAAQLESQLTRLETERAAREAELEKARAAKAIAEKEKVAAAAKEILAAAEKEKLAAAEKEKQAAAEKEKVAAAEKEKQAAAEKVKLAAAAEQAKRQEQERAEHDEARDAKAQAANEAKRAAEQQRAERARALEGAVAAKEEAAADRKGRADALQEAKAQAANEAKRAAEQQRAERTRALQDAIAAKRAAAADRKRRAEELRGAKRHARQGVMVARAPTEQGSAHGDSGKAGPRRTVTFVGFKQESNSSRVYVRTNGPVHYSVSEAKDRTVVLELDNARVASKNTGRSFDTSHFDSAVAMVSTNQVPSHRVQLEIRLKDAVSYRAKQDGNEVSLEFNNPTPR